jgi:hypothetical protein
MVKPRRWAIKMLVSLTSGVLVIGTFLVGPRLLEWLFSTEHVLNGTCPDGTPYRATITGSKYFGSKTDFWGCDGGTPQALFSHFRLHLGSENREVYIPDECLARLNMVHHWFVDVACENDESIFTFRGADGAAAYFCEFHLSELKLRRVHIAWGEDPDWWEDRTLDSSGTRISLIERSDMRVSRGWP